MTITHKDFLRLLPRALGGTPYSVQDRQITVETMDGQVQISLGPEQTRKLASLSLPRMLVTIDLSSHDPGQAEKFIRRFDLAYQKGGG